MILRITERGALLQSRINCCKEPAGEISRPLNAGGSHQPALLGRGDGAEPLGKSFAEVLGV